MMQGCRTWNTLIFLWCTVNVMAGRPKQVVMCLSSIINPSNHKTSTFDKINAIFLMRIQETIQRWGDRAASENKKIGHLLWVRLSFTLLKQSYSSPNCLQQTKKSCSPNRFSSLKQIEVKLFVKALRGMWGKRAPSAWTPEQARHLFQYHPILYLVLINYIAVLPMQAL